MYTSRWYKLFYLLHISSNVTWRQWEENYLVPITNHWSLWIIHCENLLQVKLCIIVVSLLFLHTAEGQERSDFSDGRKNPLWKLCCTCEHDPLRHWGRKWLKRAAAQCLHFTVNHCRCVCLCACKPEIFL